MKTSKITNLLGAASLVAGLGSVSVPANANGTDEPTDPDVCSSQPERCGGGDVNVDNDVNVDVDNTNTNTNVNNNNVNVRNGGNAPAVMVNAGRCQNGVGISIGTFEVSGGFTFTTSNYTCMAWDAAVNIFGEGVRSGEKSIQIVALTTLGKLSPDYFGAAIAGYAEATGRCGNLTNGDIVLGANAALGGACPPVAYERHTTRRTTYDVSNVEVSCDITNTQVAEARERLTRLEAQAARMCTPANP